MSTKMENNVKWKEINPGGIITEAGNANTFKTGDWRSEKPIWLEENCKQCMLCVPTCPDTSIPVDAGGLRTDFDYDHCKGCGVCAAVCPFHAIEMVEECDEHMCSVKGDK